MPSPGLSTHLNSGQHRNLLRGMRSYRLPTAAWVLVGTWLLLVGLAGCTTIVAPTDMATDADVTTEAAAPPHFTITLDNGAITLPADISAGVVQLTMENVDTVMHTGLLRRLAADHTLEEFSTAFEQDPRSTLPLTEFLGGPDVSPGSAISGYYTLEPGTHILVDNWSQPWHYAAFTVTQPAMAAEPPTAAVSVTMREYAYDMPDSIPSGKHLWGFTNAGESLHHIGIIQLNEGATIDDVLAWSKDPQGPSPSTDLAWWNMLSPGVTSWGELDLPPGEYYAIDLVPDFVTMGMLNADHGMVKAITVTP